MKILIIGAGVGGLATYKFLTKLLHLPVTQALQQTESAPVTTIKIYESHDSPTATATATPHPSHPPSRTTTTTTTTIGGGLGLAPNGLRVLDSLSPDLAGKVIGQGSYSGARFTFRNASGKTLGRFDGGSEEMYGFGNLMTSRQGVHDSVGEGVEVEYGRRVVGVKERDTGVEVVFEDGGVEEADFVIGADGVRSVVRRDVLGEGYEAEYQGLIGVGSFLPTSLLPPEFISTLTSNPIVMTFGPCGFFGYSPCTPDSSTLMWWSTFPLPSPPTKQMSTLPTADGLESILMERHGRWRSPIDNGDYKFFRELIRVACVPERAEDILVLPVYVVPILPRFTSESGRIVLLGDAAHAMPPDSGQGVSMALEDAQTLAMLISEFLPVFSDPCRHGGKDNDSEIFKVVERHYTSLRKPRTDAVVAAAKRMGDQKRELGWWGECLRDLVLRIVCMLPDGWKGLERLRGYVVESEVGKVLEKQCLE